MGLIRTCMNCPLHKTLFQIMLMDTLPCIPRLTPVAQRMVVASYDLGLSPYYSPCQHVPRWTGSRSLSLLAEVVGCWISLLLCQRCQLTFQSCLHPPCTPGHHGQMYIIIWLIDIADPEWDMFLNRRQPATLVV